MYKFWTSSSNLDELIVRKCGYCVTMQAIQQQCHEGAAPSEGVPQGIYLKIVVLEEHSNKKDGPPHGNKDKGGVPYSLMMRYLRLVEGIR